MVETTTPVSVLPAERKKATPFIVMAVVAFFVTLIVRRLMSKER